MCPISNQEELTCARSGCNVVFIPKTHNQKYHDDGCCKIATNQRVMKKYYQRRDQRAGKIRICGSCTTKLSRYNDNLICSSCDSKQQIEANNSVVDMLTAVAWQA